MRELLGSMNSDKNFVDKLLIFLDPNDEGLIEYNILVEYIRNSDIFD